MRTSLLRPPSACRLLSHQLRAATQAIGVQSLCDAEIALLAERVLLPAITDPVTGFLNGTYRVALLKEAQVWAATSGCPVWYVEFDIRNVGGGNAVFGHQRCNERIVKPLTAMLRCAVEGLVNVPDGWSILFRHGGDECSAIIGGVSNDRDQKRPLTRMLDTLVRSSHEYAQYEGLDNLRHPKHPFRFSRWGTGLCYGFSAVDNRDPPEIFAEADRRVEQFKRGLAPGAPYPLKIDWKLRVRMLHTLFFGW